MTELKKFALTLSVYSPRAYEINGSFTHEAYDYKNYFTPDPPHMLKSILHQTYHICWTLYYTRPTTYAEVYFTPDLPHMLKFILHQTHHICWSLFYTRPTTYAEVYITPDPPLMLKFILHQTYHIRWSLYYTRPTTYAEVYFTPGPPLMLKFILHQTYHICWSLFYTRPTTCAEVYFTPDPPLMLKFILHQTYHITFFYFFLYAFKSASKRILLRAPMVASKHANCITFEKEASTHIFSLKWSKSRTPLCTDNDFSSEDDSNDDILDIIPCLEPLSPLLGNSWLYRRIHCQHYQGKYHTRHVIKYQLVKKSLHIISLLHKIEEVYYMS